MRIMKKRIALLSVFIMTLFSTQYLFAQENEINGSKFGLGVSLFNLAESMYEYYDEPINSIYMTVDIGNNFRLEPVVGFALYDDGYMQYSIGVGVFKRKAISNFNLLYGLRLGMSNNCETTFIAPTIGGEYFFIKNFSIGSEVQLRRLFNDGDVLTTTNSNVLVRFYF